MGLLETLFGHESPTDKLVNAVTELHSQTVRIGLEAVRATGEALDRPHEESPWFEVSREYLFLYSFLVNLRAFKILGPDRGTQFRTLFRKVMARAVCQVCRRKLRPA